VAATLFAMIDRGLGRQLRAGAIAGFIGGITIWLYEIVVWVHLLHLRTMQGLFENSAVLAFGPAVAQWPEPLPLIVSALVHFVTAMIWGIVFALLWPWLRARGIEATLAALFFGICAWIVMHNVVLALFSPAPPTYTVYSVLNGFVSHTFAFSVPVALIIKRALR
jgi:hypothetical protein